MKAKEGLFAVTDTSSLKTLELNRDINPSHVKSIANAYRSGQWMPPIFVNKRTNVVFDGNHRLFGFNTLTPEEKEANPLEVYFVETNEPDIDLAIRFNSRSKTWSIRDYMKCYTKQGFDSYLRLKGFLDEYTINLKAAIQLITGSYSCRTFQMGGLDITHEELATAVQMAELLEELNHHCVQNVFKRDIVLGFRAIFYNAENQKQKVNIAKLRKNMHKFQEPLTELSRDWNDAYKQLLK